MLAALTSLVLLQLHGTSSQAIEHPIAIRHSFDSLGRLRSIRHEDGSTSWTARDLGGRAVAQTTANLIGKVQATELFQNDGAHRIGAGGGASAERFIYGHSLDEMLFQEAGAGQLSPVVSALGSTQKLVNAQGTITQQFKYDAFGTPISGDAKVFSQLFAGAHYDAKAKLYDLRNRHYDPKIGRFLSRDPLGMHADSANLGNAYAYVGNNPLNRRDPLGLKTGDDDGPGFFDTLSFAWKVFAPVAERQIRHEAAALKADVAETMDEYNVPERIDGGLTMIGGAGWTVFGTGVAGLGIVGEVPTAGVSTAAVVGGSIIIADGLDLTQAGARQLWTGEVVTPYIEQAAINGLQKAGMSEQSATTLVKSAHGAVIAGATLGASLTTQGPKLAFAGAGTVEIVATVDALNAATAGAAALRSGASLMTGSGGDASGSGSGSGNGNEGPRDSKHYENDPDWDKFQSWAYGVDKRIAKQTHELAKATARKFRAIVQIVQEGDMVRRPISFELRETLKSMADECRPIFEELSHYKVKKITPSLDRCTQFNPVLRKNLTRLKKFLGEMKGP